MDENDLPELLLKAAQEVDAMVRPYLPIVRDAQKYMDELRPAMAAVGKLLVPPPELVQVMNAGLRDMLSPSRQQRNVAVRGPVATVSVAAPVGMVVVSDAGAATDTLTLQKATPHEVAVPLDAKTVFLAILWVFAILLPLKIPLLPPDVQTLIRDYLTTISTALIVHWRVNDSRKHND